MLIFEITKTNTPLPQKGLVPILISPPYTYVRNPGNDYANPMLLTYREETMQLLIAGLPAPLVLSSTGKLIQYLHFLPYRSIPQTQSSRPSRCIFLMDLLSRITFVLFDRKCPKKWTSLDIPPWFQFETSVYVPFRGHWSMQDVNLNCIYLQRYICKFGLWVKSLRSANPWMNVLKWSKLRSPCSGSKEQWTLCREHVNRNTVHARSALLTSWLYESGVLTKRDMRNIRDATKDSFW